MDIYKKLLIIFAVSAAVLVFAGFYNSSPLAEKAIVLSIGIDKDENGEFDVSYEIARASVHSQGDVSGSKGGNLVFGRGKTLSMALQDASERAGKLVSLGQSSIIIIGEEHFKSNNIAQVLSYFSLSDAFRDGTCVAACRGKAKELLSVTHSLSDYIGLTLDETIRHNGEKLGISYVNVADFTKMQLSEKQSSYLPLVEFVPDQGSVGGQSEGSSGRFVMERTVLFNGGSFIAEEDRDFTKTLVFFSEKDSFRTYYIEDYLSSPSISKKAAVGIVGKRIKYNCFIENGKAVFGIDMYIKVKRLRTDTDGNVSEFTAKSYGEITQADRIAVQNQVRSDSEVFFERLCKMDCDIMGIYSSFYKRLGSKWKEYVAVCPDWLKNIETRISVKVSN